MMTMRALFTSFALLVAAPTIRAQDPQPVTAGAVVRREINEGRAFVGTITPLRSTTVGSPADQRVVEFPIEEGMHLREGDVLAKLRTATLEIDLAGARAELEARSQELAELENGSRPEEIARGEAALARAAALRDYTRGQRLRTERLARDGTASPEDLDAAISNAAQAEQSYREAQADLDLLRAGPRKEQVLRARARVDAQREVVRQLEDSLGEHTIRAPFDAFVVAEYAEVGRWMARGDPVADLVELDFVDVEAKVVEDYVPALEVGTDARVEVQALPDRTFIGELAAIVPLADMRSRSFPVKVRVRNEQRGGDALLKAGMLARVTLPVGNRREALLVPKDAIVLGGASPAVVVIDPGGEDPELGAARPVPVRLGIASGSMIEVIGPLEAGQSVVVLGNERLMPGQPVRILRRVDDPGVDERALGTVGQR